MNSTFERILIIITWAVSTRLFLWATDVIQTGLQNTAMLCIYGFWSFVLGMNFIFQKPLPLIKTELKQ